MRRAVFHSKKSISAEDLSEAQPEHEFKTITITRITMNIHTQLKILALLCALPLSNSFAAKPAPPPNSLEAKLAAIDAMSDHEIVSMVMPSSQENTEQLLMDAKNDLKQDPFLAANQLPKKDAKVHRLAHKYWITHKEFESCNNNAQKQYLQAQRDGFNAQCDAAHKEVQEASSVLSVNQAMLMDAYNYQIRSSNVYQLHASLLLAKNEKLQQEKDQLQQKEAQLQQDKAQSQQREQLLLAQLRGYQLLEDGQQIEGMPHAPGGVPFKKEHKRRGSF